MAGIALFSEETADGESGLLRFYSIMECFVHRYYYNSGFLSVNRKGSRCKMGKSEIFRYTDGKNHAKILVSGTACTFALAS